MKHEERKAALAAYKERKVVGGVYRIVCQPTGAAWVGQWSDLATIQTRLWFMLRQGANISASLLAAWRAHGEANFSFDVLEEIEGDESAYVRTALLKERAAFWRKKLGAAPI
jgi:hypothetical protein